MTTAGMSRPAVLTNLTSLHRMPNLYQPAFDVDTFDASRALCPFCFADLVCEDDAWLCSNGCGQP